MTAARLPYLLLPAALGLASCHPRPLSALGQDGRPMATVARLDCPAEVTRLRLQAAAPDGRSCQYVEGPDRRVDLRLVALDGQPPQSRIAALDAEVHAMAVGGAGADGKEAGGPAGHGGDEAHVDLPFFHLDAHDGAADIRLPGVTVKADGDQAQVATVGLGGMSTVQASGGRAEIRSGGVGANGVEQAVMVASDKPGPGGDYAAGYLVEGPGAGPLVAAVYQAKGRDGAHGEDGMKRLVELNVHPASRCPRPD